VATLTKAEAARQLGIARSTLYKLIDQGKVSPTPDGMLDQTELVRVAAYVDSLKGRSRTSADTYDIPAPYQDETPHGRPQTPDRERSQTTSDERPQTSTDVLVDILREQIQVLRDELQEARQSAQAAREREALLLHMLQDMQHRYDRLLDMPRTPAPPQPSPAPQATPSRMAPPAGNARGAMRQRIVALLREHPEGLTPGEIQARLGVDRSLTDTCQGMLRYNLLKRLERGKYGALELGEAQR
jgi:hypothetical protein